MTGCVLDTSAVMALLRDEPGGADVSRRLDSAVVSSVNVSEIVAVLTRDGMTPDQVAAILNHLDLTVVEFDVDLAFDAGCLIGQTGALGLSLGDRACLALALRLKLPAVTADRAWARIDAGPGLDVELIR